MAATIPGGTSTVKVSIISPNRVLGVPASAFLKPEIKGTAYDDTPCLAFLVEHTDISGKTTRVLFDLGIRKDWQNSPPAEHENVAISLQGQWMTSADMKVVVEAVKQMNIEITTEKDTIDILDKYNIDSSTIDAVILSHWHFDHTGDLNRLPLTTRIIVGPGFTNNLLPGYPTDPDSFIDGTAFQARKVQEISFNEQLRIADLKAIDWFGDGSFYLLDTPGHAIGHLSALARTTRSEDPHSNSDTFMLLAGDVCHHAGELRPSDSMKLPSSHHDYIRLHPAKCTHMPFYTASSGGFNLDAEQMRQTVEKIQNLDSEPNVFTVLAHDNWLLDIVDLFPLTANDWRNKGWGEQSKWRFLRDFELID